MDRSGRIPIRGTYNGPDAVLEGVFMRLGGERDGFSVVPDEFIDAADTIVVLGKYSGTYRTTGKGFKANFAHVWKIQSGKVVRFVQYDVDTYLSTELYRPEDDSNLRQPVHYYFD